jgi:hypothetical protein
MSATRAAEGDPKSGHHFVEDQQCAVAVGQGAQSGEKRWIGRDEPAVPDHRLYDHGRDRVRAEQRLDGFEIVERRDDRQRGQRVRHARGVGQAECRDA